MPKIKRIKYRARPLVIPVLVTGICASTVPREITVTSTEMTQEGTFA
jgi:hypothetical protein